MTAPTVPSTVLAGLALALRSEPGRPLVTMYDDATGERVELSVATFDNWVCKLANLFGDDWGLESGERISIAMPVHWRSMATTMAAWTCGLVVTLGPGRTEMVSLTDWDDFSTEVPAQPDALVLPRVVTGSDDALIGDAGTSTHADLVARGLATAERIGLGAAGRLLTDADPASDAGIDAALLAPFATGSSVVLLLHASRERRERVATQERVTCAWP
ncbi:MAG: TIGR03089 family protein [Nocardioidaceae bacterium]